MKPSLSERNAQIPRNRDDDDDDDDDADVFARIRGYRVDVGRIRRGSRGWKIR